MSRGWNKLAKFTALLKDEQLRSSLPETRLLNDYNLWYLLDKYQKVILKPLNGTGGSGIIVISYLGNNKYEVHVRSKRQWITGKTPTSLYLKRSIIFKNYIVQRHIPLARLNNRPIDLRVMVQRRKGESWNITGKLAKLARSGYIVTNPEAEVFPVGQAIKEPSLIIRIDKLALRAAQQLNKFYPKLLTIGLDIGVDKFRKIWIIEANFAPYTKWFLELPNKKMYRTIMSYKKHL